MWQGRQDLNPQPTVLETATLPIELHPCLRLVATIRPNPLFGFLVRRMLLAELAIFVESQTIRIILFVFIRLIVALLALGTS
jgi:hypothetical protein